MKTEQRKKEDCELLDKLFSYSKVNGMEYWIDKFKADNDLLPKPKLEFNRWIANDSWGDELFMYDKQNSLMYGTGADGSWLYSDLFHGNPNTDKGNRYATPEEIETKLSAMAVKMGYVEGVEVVDACVDTEETLIGSFHADGSGLGFGSTWILYNGKWAKIISKPKHIQDAIDVLEKEYIITIEKK